MADSRDNCGDQQVVTDDPSSRPLSARLLGLTDGRLRLWLTPREPVAAAGLGSDPRHAWESLTSTNLAADWENAAERLSGLAFPSFTGATHPGERRALYHLVRWLGARSVLEVGTHLGAGTITLALALDDELRGGNVVTVDIAEVSAPAIPSLAEMVKSLGLRSTVTRVRRSSVNFLADTQDRFDLIFLDGAHDAHIVYSEIARSTHRLRQGGYIVLHDYFPRALPLGAAQYLIAGPYRAVRRLQKEVPDLVAAPVGELPWPVIGSTYASTLAILGRR